MKKLFILLIVIGLLASCNEAIPSNHQGAVVIEKYTTLSGYNKLILEVDDTYDNIIPNKKALITITVKKYYYDKYNVGDTIK